MKYSQHPLDNKLLLGRYRVMRLLGEGGMGTVHLARVEGAEGFTRPVVVKRMKRDIGATEEGNRLFIREAKILSKLQHPGIVGISDFGVEDGAHIMVLEYVHGYTLLPWLDYRHRCNLPLPVDLCVYIVRRILDALHYAHHFDTEEGREIQIVHRDVSPDNVLLSNNGYVHLLDFGIASMTGPQANASTKSGAFRGKLCYSAPETVKGEPATPHSDQYSAAVVLLELLTGETPFEANSIALTFARMVNDTPDPPSKFRDDIPDGLDEVLARALDKDPSNRFESAFAFSKELRQLQQDDDEDTAQRLKDVVRNEFELLPREVGVESLKEREAALERILSNAPEPLSSAKTVHGLPPHAVATIVDRDSHVQVETAGAGVTPPAQRQLHGLLWGLLVIGGLIAIGLGAAVALLSRGGNPEQVVVVRGDRPDSHEGTAEDEPATLEPKGGGAPQNTHVSPRVAQIAGGMNRDGNPTAGTGGRSTQENRSGSTVTATPKPTGGTGTGDKLSGAVQQQSGAYQACFAGHMANTKATPQATLHFSVAQQGGAAQVRVEPNNVATTPLGICLKGAAARVQFPPLDAPVAFRVPVRARISR
jgi:serine/threonine-protein kinase